MQSMQAIGYREIAFDLTHFGELSGTTSDIIAQNTRNYAKRQITFFKKLPNLRPLDAELPVSSMVEQIAREYNGKRNDL